ncbi:MAG: hypothetical protein M1828_004722 [Chrysothrix sp. TS-e1954]|nr:MAG: hypothetical protein M1828_004722 [Chrysothrix sp. TS-e1954]
MGLEEEFEEAVAAVRKIDFSTSALEELNVFETTIRFLGGLLSAYDISGGLHQMLYVRAIELGKVIYKAFDTPNRMPIVRFDWHQALGGAEQEASDSSLVAEIGSLTLELTYLAQHTMDENYYDAITRVSNVFHAQQNATRLPGLFPLVVNARDSNFTEGSLFTLGGMVDSLYEYLPKQYLLLGGQSQQYRELYEQALIQMKRHIFFRPMTPEGHDILLAGSVEVGGTSDDPTVTLNPEVQHLTCFVGGMVALGAKAFANPSDLDLARKLVDGCTWAYDIMPMGIMPEIMHAIPCPTLDHCEWDEERWRNEVKARGESTSSIDEIIQQNHLPRGVSKVDDTRYGLRPEAIESVFILYRITGDTKLQDKAWQMFESIIKATRTDIGAAALSDCTRPEVPPTDRMESFWLAETLKYFYLIFSEPELISLDEYVLNTEAHPLKRPDYEK